MADFYDAKAVEEKFYKIWEERGYFELDGNKKIQEKGKNFCIMMPPPNVTGVLHIGHSLTFTLQAIAHSINQAWITQESPRKTSSKRDF